MLYDNEGIFEDIIFEVVYTLCDQNEQNKMMKTFDKYVEMIDSLIKTYCPTETNFFF